MNKTKIEWSDYTWSPVTGCLHNCPYCYARKIANRFDGSSYQNKRYATEHCNLKLFPSTGYGFYKNHSIDKCVIDENMKKVSYPFGFTPTFHRYRLNEPARTKKPQTIFVCSMADLFGDWVPDEWIKEVFEACEKAPQHQYLFLTKNPTRYTKLEFAGILPQESNYWYGHTVTVQENALISIPNGYNSFISAEPLLGPLEGVVGYAPFQLPLNWVIIGAETGNRKDKVVPQKAWIDDIVSQCKRVNIPVFMKNSLLPIMGEENMKREYPKLDGGAV